MGQSWTAKVRRVGILCAVNLSLYLNCFAGVDQGEKKVTLNVVEESCVKVFKQIEKQTKMSFFYSTSDIRLPGKVSINVVDAALDEVMGRILEGTNLEWIYTDNVITIRKKKGLEGGGNGTGTVADSNINMITVTGKVTQADGTGIPGATVRIKRNNDGTTTDSEGNFSLQNARRNDLLLVSSIGYETREISVSGKTIQIKLTLDVSKLDEAVIIAYGTSTKRYLTGNISKISSKEIEKQPVGDILAALAGRVPGMLVQQTSGIAGSSFTVKLRGQNSITTNRNDPLYIVDGVPFNSVPLTAGSNIDNGASVEPSPFNSLNPLDIESVEVLKDADATAIYGSRGANGVILITTKKGTTGKTKFDINAYAGLASVTRKITLLNTQEYIRMRKEAYNNDGIINYPNNAYDINGTWDTTRYTNWQKEVIGNTSHFTNAQATLAGGNQLIQYLVSSGYRKETSVFPGEYMDQKGSFHINLNLLSNNRKLKVGILANYVSDKNKLPLYDLTNYILLAPNAPEIYNADKTLNWENGNWDNPFKTLLQKDESTTTNLISNLNVSYEIIPNLYIKGGFGFSTLDLSKKRLTPKSSLNPFYTWEQSSATFFSSDSRTINIEPQINYIKTIGQSKFNILFGSTFLETKTNSLSQTGTNFSSDALLENIQAASIITINSVGYSKYRYNAIFGRINYSLKDKYLLNLTGRRDGSSRFGPGKRFANFGAVGVGWIFSEERLLSNKIPWLSFGKLRVSYGTTGNDQIGDYGYLDTYETVPNPYQGIPGMNPTRLFNPNFAWETVRKAEIGMELGFMQDRFLLSISYYRNRTSNQLVGYNLPSTTGFTSVIANLPATIQNTGMEFDGTISAIKTKFLSWTTNFNLTIPRNKLVSYPDIESSSYADRYVVGHSLFISKSYHSLGVDPKSGLYQFEDYNKDGRITYPDDVQKITFTGQQFFGGIQNRIQLLGVELDFLFQFVRQKYGSNYLSIFSRPGTMNNQSSLVLSRWKQENEISQIQRYSASSFDAASAFSLQRNSDAAYTDASFVRLKNISISYMIPIKLSKKYSIDYAKVYAQGQNILTVTKYKGLDPETKVLLPPLKVFTIGLQLTF